MAEPVLHVGRDVLEPGRPVAGVLGPGRSNPNLGRLVSARGSASAREWIPILPPALEPGRQATCLVGQLGWPGYGLGLRDAPGGSYPAGAWSLGEFRSLEPGWETPGLAGGRADQALGPAYGPGSPHAPCRKREHRGGLEPGR